MASIAATAGRVGKGRKQRPNSKATSKTRKSKTPKGSLFKADKGVKDPDSNDDDMDVDPPNDDDALDWCSFINTFDVCITTYSVLRQDLNVARAAPVRPRREDVVYSSVTRARSPLVMCEWYRVIMDEV